MPLLQSARIRLKKHFFANLDDRFTEMVSLVKQVDRSRSEFQFFFSNVTRVAFVFRELWYTGVLYAIYLSFLVVGDPVYRHQAQFIDLGTGTNAERLHAHSPAVLQGRSEPADTDVFLCIVICLHNDR